MNEIELIAARMLALLSEGAGPTHFDRPATIRRFEETFPLALDKPCSRPPERMRAPRWPVFGAGGEPEPPPAESPKRFDEFFNLTHEHV